MINMVSVHDQYIIQSFLSLIANKNNRIVFDEFLGFVFGLAMAPDRIAFEEWISWVTNGEEVPYNSIEQAEEINSCLQKIYDKFLDNFRIGMLEFPFDTQSLNAVEHSSLQQWVLGFIDALSLRDEYWGLDVVNLSAETREELFYNMLIVNGVVEPEVVLEVVENIPVYEVQVLFPGINTHHNDVLKKISQLCISLLKDAIDWMQHHSRFLNEMVEKQVDTGLPDNATGKKCNIIFVDFKKKRLRR